MPLYEYKCEKCRKIHEVMQKFSDAPMTACPDCGEPVEKLISLSSFALKGSGWYTTDYKRAAKPGSSSSSSSEGSSSTSSAETLIKASETKPSSSTSSSGSSDKA